MATKTTFHLSISRGQLLIARARAYLAQRDPLILIALTCIPLIGLLITLTVIRAQLLSPAVALAPTPPLPIIIVATARAEALPTPAAQPAAYQPLAVRYVVAFAAPGGDVLGPIAAPSMDAITGRWGDDWLSTTHEGATVWVRSADLGGSLANLAPAAPAPAPQVVYVASQVQAPAEAVPTPARELDGFYAPPNTSIEDRQKLIGSDPNALACGGSPLCGGLTNAEAQAALDQERERTLNIQAHYANEHSATPMPMTPPTDVEKEWIRVESCTEHPDWCK